MSSAFTSSGYLKRLKLSALILLALLCFGQAQMEFASDYMVSVFGGFSIPVDMESYENNEGLHAGGVFLFRNNNYLGVGGKGSFQTFGYDNYSDSTGEVVGKFFNVFHLSPVLRLKTPGKNQGTYSFLDFGPGFYQESHVLKKRYNPIFQETSNESTTKRWRSYTDLGLHVTGGMLINHFLLQFSIDHIWGTQGQATWFNISGGLGI